ncbi:hypothetical protein [Sphingomonas sp. STIS6.2]|uniref:hypothetical protein n=1 Tax=Sphingomonas sp. STIS6.2 TaxID=1379700 RepID=UPI00131E6B56|nr:hypothetical protein [Sphingomonas sp. STIS6.2]
MPFLLSITGRLTVRHPQLISTPDVMERLRAALLAQTVDTIAMTGDAIRFTPQAKGGESKPRPEGGGWMFNALGVCSLRLHQEVEGVTVVYRLDCRLWFCIATAISIMAGVVIRLSAGPDHEWRWVFALGFWLLFFLSGFLSKTFEIRSWLKTNLTSLELPPTKRLRVPVDPS